MIKTVGWLDFAAEKYELGYETVLTNPEALLSLRLSIQTTVKPKLVFTHLLVNQLLNKYTLFMPGS